MPSLDNKPSHASIVRRHFDVLAQVAPASAGSSPHPKRWRRLRKDEPFPFQRAFHSEMLPIRCDSSSATRRRYFGVRSSARWSNATGCAVAVKPADLQRSHLGDQRH
jgi:hypothetical protein